MAEDKGIAEGQQGGGKKKLIVIIAGALVLLMGAGAATFFLLGDGGPGAAADGASGEETAAVEKADPVYFKLAPAFVVNLPGGGSVKMLQIAVEVMTRTPSLTETLKANDPMIRHHLLNLLEQQQAADLMTVDGREGLQQAILDLLSEKLKSLNEPGQIEGVFFTQFVMQ
jgi:flagellar FliL protein